MTPAAKIAATFVIAAGLLLAACGNDDDGGNPTGRMTTAERIAAIDYPEDMADGRRVGASAAPAHLQVFIDFRCPHCMRLTALMEPMIVDEYVSEGHLVLEIRDFPVLGDESANAAVAARCAEQQDRYWEYHKALFINQADNGTFSHGDFLDIADDLGLDGEAFEACIGDEQVLEAVGDDYAAAQAFGLAGTPGFVLNGQALADVPGSLDAWRELLDRHLH